MKISELLRNKNFEKRIKDFQKKVLQEVSSSFLSEVKSNAIHETYANNIEIKQIGDDLAITVSMNKSESIGNVENSVFYYVPADKVAAASRTYAILAQHQPYLKNLLPLKADIKRFRLQFKRVSVLEYERLTFPARVQNFKFRIAPNIKNALMRAGENSSLIFADIDKETPVQEDLVFTVLRKELGLRGTSEPVWITAIKEIGKASYLNEAVKKSLPILDGKSFGNVEKYDKISNDVAIAIGEFEKKILK